MELLSYISGVKNVSRFHAYSVPPTWYPELQTTMQVAPSQVIAAALVGKLGYSSGLSINFFHFASNLWIIGITNIWIELLNLNHY